MARQIPASAETGGRATPPETIEDAPLSVEAASELMGRFGFVAFRTPPEARAPDSCLMAILRDVPTLEHFDPELVTYWAFRDGHGRLDTIDRRAPPSVARPFSWGRIRLIDRLGKRNGFVSFGGQLTTAAVGRDALLVIFRSASPILRLPGHSQFGDRLGDEVLAFFGRVVPCFWASADVERLIGSASPDALYAAFLLHEAARLTNGESDITDGRRAEIQRDIALLSAKQPTALDAGGQLLRALGPAFVPRSGGHSTFGITAPAD